MEFFSIWVCPKCKESKENLKVNVKDQTCKHCGEKVMPVQIYLDHMELDERTRLIEKFATDSKSVGGAKSENLLRMVHAILISNEWYESNVRSLKRKLDAHFNK